MGGVIGYPKKFNETILKDMLESYLIYNGFTTQEDTKITMYVHYLKAMKAKGLKSQLKVKEISQSTIQPSLDVL